MANDCLSPMRSCLGHLLSTVLLVAGLPTGAPLAQTQPPIKSETLAGPNTLGAAAKPATDKTVTLAMKIPRYVPPFMGAPGGRVVGGSRSAPTGCTVDSLAVLAPDDRALTSTQAPELYWYVSNDITPVRTEIRVTDPAARATIYRKDVAGRIGKGFHRVSLEEDNIKLEAGKSYQWSVSLVCDDQKRAADTVSAAKLEYLPSSPEIVKLIAQTPFQDLAAAYAASGYWYDAFAATNPISSDASNAARDTLLNQVDLAKHL